MESNNEIDRSRNPRGPGAARFLARCGVLLLQVLATPMFAAADTRGWLGIYHEPVSPLPPVEVQAGGTAALRGATAGLRVTAVFPDSPAEQGGLRTGDIMIAVRGVPFACAPESLGPTFQRLMTPLRATEPCPILVLRDGVERTLRRDREPARPEDEAAFWWKPGTLLDSLRSGGTLEASRARCWTACVRVGRWRRGRSEGSRLWSCRWSWDCDRRRAGRPAFPTRPS